LFSGNIVNSQQIDCKVLKPGISESYSGGCKKGLADGTYYEGHFENGNREGSGKMVYRDSAKKVLLISNRTCSVARERIELSTS
jgi:hypothetical protein